MVLETKEGWHRRERERERDPRATAKMRGSGGDWAEQGLVGLPSLLCRHEEIHERSRVRQRMIEQFPGRGGSLEDGVRGGEEGMVHGQEVAEAMRPSRKV